MRYLANRVELGWFLAGFILLVVVLNVVVLFFNNKLMAWRGYGAGSRRLVQCSSGHRFPMTWVPGLTLTSIKIGVDRRLTKCPVGNHWAIVQLVRMEDWTATERAEIEGHHQ